MIASLIVEANPINARYILQILSVFVIDESEFIPGIISTAAQIILGKMIIPHLWSPEVVYSALDTLNVFAEFAHNSADENVIIDLFRL